MANQLSDYLLQHNITLFAIQLVYAVNCFR